LLRHLFVYEDPEVNKMTGQAPVAKFRAGQVASAVWGNEVEVKY